jgi:hypothetical protein
MCRTCDAVATCPLGASCCPAGQAMVSGPDFNQGAGGDYVYLCASSSNRSGGKPAALSSTVQSHSLPAELPCAVQIADLSQCQRVCVCVCVCVCVLSTPHHRTHSVCHTFRRRPGRGLPSGFHKGKKAIPAVVSSEFKCRCQECRQTQWGLPCLCLLTHRRLQRLPHSELRILQGGGGAFGRCRPPL